MVREELVRNWPYVVSDNFFGNSENCSQFLRRAEGGNITLVMKLNTVKFTEIQLLDLLVVKIKGLTETFLSA